MKNNGERLVIRASFCLLSNFYNFLLPALPTFSSPIHSATHCHQDIPYLSTATAMAKTNNEHIIANPNSMLSSHVAQCVEADVTNSSLWGSHRCWSPKDFDLPFSEHIIEFRSFERRGATGHYPGNKMWKEITWAEVLRANTWSSTTLALCRGNEQCFRWWKLHKRSAQVPQ